jgi:hypothetical protein
VLIKVVYGSGTPKNRSRSWKLIQIRNTAATSVSSVLMNLIKLSILVSLATQAVPFATSVLRACTVVHVIDVNKEQDRSKNVCAFFHRSLIYITTIKK